MFRCNELLETSQCSGEASGVQSSPPAQLKLWLQAASEQAFLSAFISSGSDLSSLKSASRHLFLSLHICASLRISAVVASWGCLSVLGFVCFVFFRGSLANFSFLLKKYIFNLGVPGWLSGLKPLPSAWVMIPGSWDRAPVGLSAQRGACFLLSLPAAL